MAYIPKTIPVISKVNKNLSEASDYHVNVLPTVTAAARAGADYVQALKAQGITDPVTLDRAKTDYDRIAGVVSSKDMTGAAKKLGGTVYDEVSSMGKGLAEVGKKVVKTAMPWMPVAATSASLEPDELDELIAGMISGGIEDVGTLTDDEALSDKMLRAPVNTVMSLVPIVGAAGRKLGKLGKAAEAAESMEAADKFSKIPKPKHGKLEREAGDLDRAIQDSEAAIEKRKKYGPGAKEGMKWEDEDVGQPNDLKLAPRKPFDPDDPEAPDAIPGKGIERSQPPDQIEREAPRKRYKDPLDIEDEEKQRIREENEKDYDTYKREISDEDVMDLAKRGDDVAGRQTPVEREIRNETDRPGIMNDEQYGEFLEKYPMGSGGLTESIPKYRPKGSAKGSAPDIDLGPDGRNVVEPKPEPDMSMAGDDELMALIEDKVRSEQGMEAAGPSGTRPATTWERIKEKITGEVPKTTVIDEPKPVIAKPSQTVKPSASKPSKKLLIVESDSD